MRELTENSYHYGRRGIELSELGESRVEPVPGYDLHLSLDKNIQMYAQQAAEKVMEQKQADAVSILLLNPQNGEIYANANVPEFNLNEPFRLNTDTTGMTEKEKQDACNQMWRNLTINDTYEPVLLSKSSPWQQGFLRELCIRMTNFPAQALRWWRTDVFIAIKEQDTVRKILCRVR